MLKAKGASRFTYLLRNRDALYGAETDGLFRVAALAHPRRPFEECLEAVGFAFLPAGLDNLGIRDEVFTAMVDGIPVRLIDPALLRVKVARGRDALRNEEHVDL